MSVILITGGAGFIASSLVERLAEKRDDQIVIIDDLSTGEYEKISTSKHKNVIFIKCDANNFNDISSVFYRYRFDYVFHYAAVVGVKRTLDNPIKVLNDLSGINHILSLSKNTGVKRVYYSSSSEVYGEPVEYPQNEHTTPLNSRLPYAIVKNAGEAYLKSYEKEFGLHYTVFRFFNTYGPKQSKDFVVSKFINGALKNENLTIYGDGLQTRTFCHIDDNIEATTKAFYEDLHVNDIVNIGSDIEVPIIALAEKIIKITKSKSKIIYLPALEEGDMTRRKPDISKMRRLLKRDLLPLEDGLKMLIKNTKFIL